MEPSNKPGLQPDLQATPFPGAIQRFWLAVTTPGEKDEALARREYMTRVILFSMAWLLLLFTLIILGGVIAGWFFPIDLAIMLGIWLPVFTAWLATVRGAWRVTGPVPALVFLILGAFGSYNAGMVTNFVLSYAIAILLAGVLLSTRSAWGMLAASLALHLGFGWYHRPADPLEYVIVSIMFSGFTMGITVIQQFFAQVLHNTVENTRKAAQRLEKEIDEHADAARKLRQRNRELQLLNQVVAASNSSLDLHEMLRTSIQALATGLGMEQGGVALLEPGQNHLRVVAEYHQDENSANVVGAIIPIAGNLSTEYVLSTRKALSIIDARNDPRMALVQDLMRSRNIQSILIIPLIIHQQVIGTLGLESSTVHEFSEEEIALASNAILATAQAIENSNLYTQVQNLAMHDDLTGLLNRRGLFEFGRREVERARRFGRPLAALFIDVDLLKRINDRLGHATGDFALQQIATGIRLHTRNVDVVGRYAGDEFVVLLTETDLPKAGEVAQRLSSFIQAMPALSEDAQIKLSVSIGVVTLTDDIDDLDILIARADQVMYDAKEQGRNRINLPSA